MSLQARKALFHSVLAQLLNGPHGLQTSNPPASAFQKVVTAPRLSALCFCTKFSSVLCFFWSGSSLGSFWSLNLYVYIDLRYTEFSANIFFTNIFYTWHFLLFSRTLVTGILDLLLLSQGHSHSSLVFSRLHHLYQLFTKSSSTLCASERTEMFNLVCSPEQNHPMGSL